MTEVSLDESVLTTSHKMKISDDNSSSGAVIDPSSPYMNFESFPSSGEETAVDSSVIGALPSSEDVSSSHYFHSIPAKSSLYSAGSHREVNAYSITFVFL